MMREKWKRLNKISAWAKKHTFLAVCAFAILVCLLVCVVFIVNYVLTIIPVEKSNGTVAEFSDEAFEAAIRQSFGNSEGDIYLEDLYCMKSLSLTNQPLLTDLGDLEFFPNLTKLTISNCAVYDISPIGELKYLEEAHLSKNRIRDLSPICGLDRLRILDLSANNISQLPEMIGNLDKLTDLVVPNNRISSLDPVLGCENLRLLNMRGNRLQQLPDMAALKALTTMDFGYNAIARIAPMAEMESIEELIVEGNLLQNAEFLRDQKSIIAVDISFNDIEDISVLSTCSKLESLTLYGVEEFDLSPLAQLPKFNSLFLDQNFRRKGNIDFMFGRFKAGDRTTVIYIVSKNNMIGEY